ncbi:ORF85 similar to AcMNPV ORF101 [Cydia pomonella granulovirus]|uniref:BV/ODV-c42 n=2 Tax=Cydia pomonella granulosis virus TaxID=28289 RepID=A0A097P0R9_GVCP|nr:ORF85 similar to AcMNPV ORF101 [Cydia pomonella granulovirus]AAK70745.1 ORF85 similar to AcMNPV ORF101 [Cydia pomonella granulovirus]AIU36732.1 ORF85 bv/odv-c42 [Cydia pomonella granulovirus]AIU37011.1 ORF85 bv/odv-c42 [Cydia pomonella granulovirus]AIU37153.1 ORF85 bv/odv-c42 [Cydia pomonella granulovirus]AIU37292.1 ORF85 bv/odv-c42 [Cydia pomonella granulovirus]
MSSAKTRLFLTIEKLKNSMDDPQMTYPFWEKFFPLLGTSTTVTVELSTLSELINEAAETAEQLIITQGGVVYSQYVQNAAPPTLSASLNPARRLLVPTATTATLPLDTKRYHSFAEKVANYFVSASVQSTMYTVKDIVKLYLYLSHIPKYKPLYQLLEETLFTKQRNCVPIISTEKMSLVLDNLRDLTVITNFRLDQEAVNLMVHNLQVALNNELSKYPTVKVKDFISTSNVYEKEVEPAKAFGDKFELLVAQKHTHQVLAADNTLLFNSNPVIVENIAASIEANCDINRMVYNSINNIFINSVEQSAAENIKFDVDDYNRRFRVLDRVRDNLRNNFVEKVAAGDISIKKRITTNKPTQLNQPPIALKKRRTSLNPLVVD